MKKLYTAVLMVLFCASSLVGAERLELSKVSPDKFTEDTQILFQEGGDSHISMAWWIPSEFWRSVFKRDAGVSQAELQQMVDILDGVSLIAIVQADISAFGSFDFYPKDEVAKGLKIVLNDGDRAKVVQQKTNISPDLQMLLSMFQPILGSSMGNLGNNMHFFVLDDGEDERVLDPYEYGKLEVSLQKRGGKELNSYIQMPLNALFVPRICPNGKEAHISWNYCPWSGQKL